MNDYIKTRKSKCTNNNDQQDQLIEQLRTEILQLKTQINNDNKELNAKLNKYEKEIDHIKSKQSCINKTKYSSKLSACPNNPHSFANLPNSGKPNYSSFISNDNNNSNTKTNSNNNNNNINDCSNNDPSSSIVVIEWRTGPNVGRVSIVNMNDYSFMFDPQPDYVTALNLLKFVCGT